MVTAGPAFKAAADAVLTNKPAPIMAPIPKATKEPALNVRFKPFSLSEASASKELTDFLINKLIRMLGLII